jgi:hypothetical protein
MSPQPSQAWACAGFRGHGERDVLTQHHEGCAQAGSCHPRQRHLLGDVAVHMGESEPYAMW